MQREGGDRGVSLGGATTLNVLHHPSVSYSCSRWYTPACDSAACSSLSGGCTRPGRAFSHGTACQVVVDGVRWWFGARRG